MSTPLSPPRYGLDPADTWETFRQQDVPLVMPMMPGTFPRPDDWAPRTDLTDFIFLRSAAPGARRPGRGRRGGGRGRARGAGGAGGGSGAARARRRGAGSTASVSARRPPALSRR